MRFILKLNLFSQMYEKLEKILKLRSKAELESAAAELNLSEVHQIMSIIDQKEKGNEEKLMPLLVGMPAQTFYQLLKEIAPLELKLLKEIGPTEALHHKLLAFFHDWTFELNALGVQTENLEKQVEKLPLQDLKKEEILSLKEQIDALGTQIEEHLATLNNALTVAWNTKWIDIIDHLSHLKDQYLRLNASFVGVPKNSEHAASGLYKQLEERLARVYCLKEGQERLRLLAGEEPAIEALASLGIFYLEDYWNLGLLSGYSSLRELRQALRTKTHEEKTVVLEELIKKAEDKLKSLGLANVNSLKEANIFSKEMLLEYIQKS